MNGDVFFALGPQNEVVTFVGQGNVPPSMSDTVSDTRSVTRVTQNSHRFAMSDEKLHLRAFSNTSELSGCTGQIRAVLLGAQVLHQYRVSRQETQSM